MTARAGGSVGLSTAVVASEPGPVPVDMVPDCNSALRSASRLRERRRYQYTSPAAAVKSTPPTTPTAMPMMVPCDMDWELLLPYAAAKGTKSSRQHFPLPSSPFTAPAGFQLTPSTVVAQVD